MKGSRGNSARGADVGIQSPAVDPPLEPLPMEGWNRGWMTLSRGLASASHVLSHNFSVYFWTAAQIYIFGLYRLSSLSLGIWRTCKTTSKTTSFFSSSASYKILGIDNATIIPCLWHYGVLLCWGVRLRLGPSQSSFLKLVFDVLDVGRWFFEICVCAVSQSTYFLGKYNNVLFIILFACLCRLVHNSLINVHSSRGIWAAKGLRAFTLLYFPKLHVACLSILLASCRNEGISSSLFNLSWASLWSSCQMVFDAVGPLALYDI